MLPEVGGSELILIAVVALIVVGPKDLPIMLRKVGQFVGKLRGMAAEFRASFDEMARQSELDELRREVEAMRRGQSFDMSSTSAAADEVHGDVSQIFNEIGDSLQASGVQLHPPMSHQIESATEAPSLEIKAAGAEAAPKPRKRAKPRTDDASPAAKAPAKRKAAAKPAAKAPARPRKAKEAQS